MRSLPPPRITTARKWKRIKRSMKSLFTSGNITDFSPFARRQNQNYSISKFKVSRITHRFKKQQDIGIVQTGIKTAGFLGKLASKTSSFPNFRKLNVDENITNNNLNETAKKLNLTATF